MTMPETTQSDLVERRFLLVKRGLYYAPDNHGYTGFKDKAGRYLESDAYEGVRAIHVDQAEEFAPACFVDLKVDCLTKQRDDARGEITRLRAHCEAMAKALETTHSLLECIEQRSADNMWRVNADDPETACGDTYHAVGTVLTAYRKGNTA
ncbi:hypothetical protein [Novosphingobium sp. RL4]|uniref:hypothetical protein n=1 Tax=Novosphingobium sp. RL4 TaxID=3109595 RepID=UPI002D772FEE|nr:hypothetical protein [Novosphingobium sp. RL4]WRT91945.1 hypothetical protein U9J33_12060 [Novosphingobium sp. RL4]